MNLEPLLEMLKDRIKEVAWQLTKYQGNFPFFLLPPGLFSEKHPEEFITTLQKEIEVLSTLTQAHASYYLAKRIKQKIDVLVAICAQKKKSTSTLSTKLTGISTRQQWHNQLEKKIAALVLQKEALEKRLKDPCLLSVEARTTLQQEKKMLEEHIRVVKEGFSTSL